MRIKVNMSFHELEWTTVFGDTDRSLLLCLASLAVALLGAFKGSCPLLRLTGLLARHIATVVRRHLVHSRRPTTILSALQEEQYRVWHCKTGCAYIRAAAIRAFLNNLHHGHVCYTMVQIHSTAIAIVLFARAALCQISPWSECSKEGKYLPLGAVFTGCGDCPAGNYCPEGTLTPVQCPPGTFQDLQRQGVCQPCMQVGLCLLLHSLTGPTNVRHDHCMCDAGPRVRGQRHGCAHAMPLGQG